MRNLGTFAATINCMDGRAQLPIIEYLKEEFKVEYIDIITEAGPNKILAEGKPKALVDAIKNRYELSINLHGTKAVAVAGHHNCGGNPAGELEQIKQIKSACALVKSWNPDIEVIGIWVDENWKAHIMTKDIHKRC